MFKKIAVTIAIFFLTLVISSVACATQEFVLHNGKVFKVDTDGSEKLVEGAEVEAHEDEGKIIYSMTMEEKGIYFFDKNEKFISFLPCEDASNSYVYFSPDMTQFILDGGTYVDREYLLYQFEGLKLKKTFYGISPLIWVDHMRFAFTLIDTEKKGRRESADISGWLSVVLYDSAIEELLTIIAATDKTDYMLEAVDEGNIWITEFSVRDKADWADEEKVEMKEITKEIPAAG